MKELTIPEEVDVEALEETSNALDDATKEAEKAQDLLSDIQLKANYLGTLSKNVSEQIARTKEVLERL